MNQERTLYEKVREDILNGTFDKKEKLTEIKLAKLYDVSRTPIREVLKQLEFEYLVKDGYVYTPSPEDYRDLFEMRILIESHAVEKAVLLFVEEDLKELRNYIKQAKDGDDSLTLAANKKFHDKLVRAIRNPFLSETYDRLNSTIYLFSRTVVEKHRPELLDEHEQIVQAIEDRDGETARQLIVTHLQKDLEFTLYYM
ncbi:GntR family transcriptional regulator [Salinicoccus sp. ID82-1]|uniref:GntR family transcriptional regulator n=1 Tax=Salinicoccus sp. ID82-1 TaxID=2820269 RepID=UPI001F1EE651|nr:GntR family transcriptional regulator [Salinicoccus sp. ID82-1]MCG1009631.1 GntR family transcriptional regulator [Salinicoccus sp. ID82-1]